MIDKELREERLRVCETCEFYNDKRTIAGLRDVRCDACGCNLKLKAYIKMSKCPKDKWKR
jgi:ribosomal protein L37AE/L43A